MLNLIEPSCFCSFVSETMTDLSQLTEIKSLAKGEWHYFSQVRVKKENGNYDTTCFYESNVENALLFSSISASMFSHEKLNNKSDVVAQLNDPELFNKSITLNGLSFEKFKDPIYAQITEDLSPKIICYEIRLKSKPICNRPKGLLNLSYKELEDIYDIELLLTIHDHDEDKVTLSLDQIRSAAAWMGLVENKSEARTVKEKVKSLASFLQSRIDSINREVRCYSKSSHSKFSTLADNWFVPIYDYVKSGRGAFFHGVKPIVFKAKFEENVEWTPFHSPQNYNVSAMPTSKYKSKLRSALEQFVFQNTIDFSVNSSIFVPTEYYEHLNGRKLEVAIEGEYQFNMDPLPFIASWKGNVFNERDFAKTYLKALVEIALNECKGTTSDLLKGLVKQVDENVLFEKYIWQNQITSTQKLIAAMKASGDENHIKLAKCLSKCFPEFDIVFDESKPSIYNEDNPTISSSDFRGMNSEFLIAIGLQIRACQILADKHQDELKPLVLLIETTTKCKCNKAFSHVLRLNRSLAISTIYVHSQFNDEGNLVLNRTIEGVSYHVFKEDKQLGILLESGTFLGDETPTMPGLTT